MIIVLHNQFRDWWRLNSFVGNSDYIASALLHQRGHLKAQTSQLARGVKDQSDHRTGDMTVYQIYYAATDPNSVSSPCTKGILGFILPKLSCLLHRKVIVPGTSRSVDALQWAYAQLGPFLIS